MNITHTINTPEEIDAYLYSITPEFSRIYRFILYSYMNPHTYSYDEYDRTPIHYAAMIHSDFVLKMYLDMNIHNINHIDILGDTALTSAIRSCTTENCDKIVQIIEILLDYGADPNLCGSGGLTPLMLAVMKGYINIVTLLLNVGADPTIQVSEEGVFLRKGDTASSIADRIVTLLYA